jgi:hypothetical protein
MVIIASLGVKRKTRNVKRKIGYALRFTSHLSIHI